MSIHWYPGHIAKAEKKLQGQLSLVDVVIEVLDARIPESSRYEDLGRLTADKPRLLILNKSDIADPVENTKWLNFFTEKTGQKVILTSASSSKDISTIIKHAAELGKPAIDKIVQKGLLPRPIRVMVVGMPNVGKSSIINKLIKTAKARTGEKAGVTRTIQWIRIHPKLELLDTPGIIPTRLENQERAIKLAMVNSIGEAAYDKIEVAKALVKLLFERYKDLFCGYYKVTQPTLENIIESRKLLLPGGKPDFDRAAQLVLSDFRKGRIGRMTLESPQESED
ncbi:MAG: ribosome biogenesis GTPase YlqF [Candidatus Melainabacteria bacterium GWF2_37_15]|nr:MAG: ribosome biogenesis GTPase YlqF [Candidatus Melainabacteria bacterium GWF2_37_15]